MAEVFISYRRTGSAVLVNLIHRELLAHGISTFVDTDGLTGQGRFPALLCQEIERAGTVIAVLDQDWMTSAWMQEELRYAYSIGRQLLPVFTEDYVLPSGPQPAHIQALLAHNGVRVLTAQGLFIEESVARIVRMVGPRPVRRPVEVALDQLPVPVLRTLVGRDDERRALRAHLEADDVALTVVAGFGGVGKTSLVDAFLSDIAPEYGGAARVLGWHFYSQEDQGSNVANSAAFWERALRFFGCDGTLPTHEIERARELASALRTQRAVLVLDGIESLQFAPHVNHGQLSDKAVQTFLTIIARDGLPAGGLVLVTSRQPVVELARFRCVRRLDLGMLDLPAGAELLRQLGVRGSAAEVLAAVRDHRGHPLSLMLLARMLTSGYDGDVLQRINLELLDADVEDGVGLILDHHAREWTDDDPELTFLYVVALFRRPMRESELYVLVSDSDIGRRLGAPSGNRFRRAVSRLCNLGLIVSAERQYDTHALIRRYFAARLRDRHPRRYRQAHDVLFEHFRDRPAEELPADLEGMEPLYRAVYHGCLAGRYGDALDVYWHRISRRERFYSQKQLGGYSSDLMAVAPFFPDGWETPVHGDLSGEQRALLIALAAFLLAALGRLADAVRPRYAEIAMFEELGDQRLVCGDLRNLVQTLLPLGRLDGALRAADRAVAAAVAMTTGRPGVYSAGLDERFLHVSALVRRATVLHRMGRLAPAGQAYDEAVALQGGPLDHANAYFHGLYLADTARGPDDLAVLLELGRRNLAAATARGDLGDSGYSRLTMALARQLGGELPAAEADLDAAIATLTKASRVDRLPAALIQRAELHRRLWLAGADDQRRERADADLGEAEQMIDFSGMLLHRVDLTLLRIALQLDDGDAARATELMDTTLRPDIERTGYHLRDAAVAALQRRLGAG